MQHTTTLVKLILLRHLLRKNRLITKTHENCYSCKILTEKCPYLLHPGRISPCLFPSCCSNATVLFFLQSKLLKKLSIFFLENRKSISIFPFIYQIPFFWLAKLSVTNKNLLKRSSYLSVEHHIPYIIIICCIIFHFLKIQLALSLDKSVT